MTEQELNIQRLQQAIKVVEMSLATGKNLRVRQQDKETLANLQAELAKFKNDLAKSEEE